MTGTTFVITCVPATSPALLATAVRVALTGRPLVGRPAALAGTFGRPAGPVLLLVVHGETGRAAALAVVDYPGPGRRIASARLTALAVDPGLGDAGVAAAARAAAEGVRYQFEYVLLRTGAVRGYVVADAPQTGPAVRSLSAAGWQTLPPAADSRTIRLAAFVDISPQDPADDDPDPDPDPVQDA